MRICRCAVLLCMTMSGCGPMLLPMTNRLPPQEQAQVDGMWENMLTPVGRTDRQTLLDCTLVYWMFQNGVDRLHLTSEKYLSHGKAVMEIDCDRANPQADQFTLCVLDDRGRTLRKERYCRAEVEQSAQALWDYNHFGNVTVQHDKETPEQRCHRLEYERRMKRVQAATQPAIVGK